MLKKWVIRCGLVVVLIILGVFLYIVGKENVIFIDNKDITIDGVTHSATAAYEIWIDGKQVGRSALAVGKRNSASVAGPSHVIELQAIQDKEPVGEKIVKEFRISARDYQVILNIPALVAGSDLFLSAAE